MMKSQTDTKVILFNLCLNKAMKYNFIFVRKFQIATCSRPTHLNEMRATLNLSSKNLMVIVINLGAPFRVCVKILQSLQVLLSTSCPRSCVTSYMFPSNSCLCHTHKTCFILILVSSSFFCVSVVLLKPLTGWV